MFAEYCLYLWDIIPSLKVKVDLLKEEDIGVEIVDFCAKGMELCESFVRFEASDVGTPDSAGVAWFIVKFMSTWLIWDVWVEIGLYC